uniref:Uncharacterized protein n=1 Tax=Rhodnius prolixus TaxID=13249 RepID=T1HI00_RHOPR
MTSIDIPTKKSSTVDNPEANLGNESGGIFACLKRVAVENLRNFVGDKSCPNEDCKDLK